VPCHAVVGANALDAFQQRILDLDTVVEAGTPAALQRAAERLGQDL
jgi:glycerate kinase